jgi:tRNA modification GTPase
MIEDGTIAAIVTPRGTGGVCVLRLSGKDSFSIGNLLFTGRKRLDEQRNWSAQFGMYIHPDSHTHIDECIVLVMRGPKSYTGEDTVEFSLHGGARIAEAALNGAVEAGARLAAPGEFSKRALMNGRMDLTQAEAVAELIAAGCDRESLIALQKLEGGLGNKLNTVKNGLLGILVEIEAGFDFSEEEVQFHNSEHSISVLQESKIICSELIDSYNEGCIIRDGIAVGLFGCVNVGKSSILNAILQEDRAIVTKHPGTTRDTVDGEIERQGIRFRFIDTAGIRYDVDEVESIGIDKSHQLIKDVDIAVHVLDAGEGFGKSDALIADRLEKERDSKSHTIICINKTDLVDKDCLDDIVGAVSEYGWTVYQSSVKLSRGIQGLVSGIAKSVLIDSKLDRTHEVVITSLRQKDILVGTVEKVDQLIQRISDKYDDEFLAADVRGLLHDVDMILGKGESDEVLNMIFNNFCIGK